MAAAIDTYHKWDESASPKCASSPKFQSPNFQGSTTATAPEPLRHKRRSSIQNLTRLFSSFARDSSSDIRRSSLKPSQVNQSTMPLLTSNGASSSDTAKLQRTQSKMEAKVNNNYIELVDADANMPRTSTEQSQVLFNPGFSMTAERGSVPARHSHLAPPRTEMPVLHQQVKRKQSIVDRLKSFGSKDGPVEDLPLPQERRGSYVPKHAASDFSRLGSVSRSSARPVSFRLPEAAPPPLPPVPAIPSDVVDKSSKTARRMSQRVPLSPLCVLEENESLSAPPPATRQLSLAPGQVSFTQPSFSERLLQEKAHSSYTEHKSQGSSNSPRSSHSDAPPDTSTTNTELDPLVTVEEMPETPFDEDKTQVFAAPAPASVPQAHKTIAGNDSSPSDYDMFVARAEAQERIYRDQMLRSITRRASLVHDVPYHHAVPGSDFEQAGVQEHAPKQTQPMIVVEPAAEPAAPLNIGVALSTSFGVSPASHEPLSPREKLEPALKVSSRRHSEWSTTSRPVPATLARVAAPPAARRESSAKSHKRTSWATQTSGLGSDGSMQMQWPPRRNSLTNDEGEYTMSARRASNAIRGSIYSAPAHPKPSSGAAAEPRAMRKQSVSMLTTKISDYIKPGRTLAPASQNGNVRSSISAAGGKRHSVYE